MRWHPGSLPSLPRQDNTRISSAGCLGELCAFLTEEELSTVLQQYLLGRPLVCTFRGLSASLPLRGSSGSWTTLSLEMSKRSFQGSCSLEHLCSEDAAVVGSGL